MSASASALEGHQTVSSQCLLSAKGRHAGGEQFRSVLLCSLLMGNDEEGTFAALKACRRELINLKIAERRGRIVKTTGDSALVEFASSVDATSCGVKIQRAIAERNASVPEVRRINFRIGINVGDITIDDRDIFSDGINVAARLEGLASRIGVAEYVVPHCERRFLPS
jgi:class 3 adenylate cyclase